MKRDVGGGYEIRRSFPSKLPTILTPKNECKGGFQGARRRQFLPRMGEIEEPTESTPSPTSLPFSTILLAVLWILDTCALVPFFGIFICLFVAVFIPCRLYGRAQIKRKVNILLILTCWINVFASIFQAIADLLNDEESYEMTRQVSIATPQVKIYLWVQNIAMMFLFVSRKMTTVIAIYWKTYSTSYAPWVFQAFFKVATVQNPFKRSKTQAAGPKIQTVQITVRK